MNTNDDNKYQTESDAPIRDERVRDARRKLEAGEYDRAQVVRAIVDRIIGTLDVGLA